MSTSSRSIIYQSEKTNLPRLTTSTSYPWYKSYHTHTQTLTCSHLCLDHSLECQTDIFRFDDPLAKKTQKKNSITLGEKFVVQSIEIR